MKTIFLGLLLVCGTTQAMLSDSQLVNVEVDRCTSIAVGPKAGTEGPMATHTADCSDCDFRIAKVPARDWPEGSMRKLYQYKGSYPATVTSDRGTTWHPSNLEGTKDQIAAWGTESIITGEIPQVKHTYAIYEAGYGIMNEHQLGIGESTCAAKFWSAPVTAGGKARIEVRELSKLALERTTNARDAIKLMGKFAVELGYYAADWSGGDASLGEGGEALSVVDPTEAWMFHVMGDDTGASAVWVAQRLEPDHVAVVANSFVIGEVDPDSDNFMYSDNLWEVASRNDLWNPEMGLLNFKVTYGPKRAHSPYATRRVWRVFNLVAPSFKLNPFTDSYAMDYPFSVKVDKPISPQDLMRIQRDHYEGTQFDMTKGLAAGPYGDPHRWDAAPVDGMTFNDVIQGAYERAISMFRTSYSIVTTARAHKPNSLALLWFCQYEPASSSYAPLYVASEDVPPPYSRGSLFKYDSNIPFWNFLAAGNYASRFYKFAMQDVFALQSDLMEESVHAVEKAESLVEKILAGDDSAISAAQSDLQSSATTTTTTTRTSSSMKDSVENFVEDTLAKVAEITQRAQETASSVAATTKEGLVAGVLTAVTYQQAYRIVGAWRDLLPQIITKYHDGYTFTKLDGPAVTPVKMFYPKWWLDATGYWNNKAATGPGVIMFGPNPMADSNGGFSLTILVTALLSCAVTLLTVYAANLAKKQAPDSLSGEGNSSNIELKSMMSGNDHNNSMDQFHMRTVPTGLRPVRTPSYSSSKYNGGRAGYQTIATEDNPQEFRV